MHFGKLPDAREKVKCDVTPLAIYTAASGTGIMALKLTAAQMEQIRDHGEATYPQECCGVLTGEMPADGDKHVRAVVRCSNEHNDLSQSWYQIDPRELLRIQREAYERGEDVIGFYHSHPDDAANWSPSDLDEAHWMGCSYLITSVQQGKPAQTNSFELTGDESSKRFKDETIVLE
jgi:proteasome lid subunit RPN8/RPN11